MSDCARYAEEGEYPAVELCHSDLRPSRKSFMELHDAVMGNTTHQSTGQSCDNTWVTRLSLCLEIDRRVIGRGGNGELR